MAGRRKRAKKKSPIRPRSAAPEHGAAASAQPRPSSGLVLAGMVPLIFAIGASLLLVLEHVGGLSLAGCGPGSACAELTQGVWGKIPLVNWPVSFVGLAYFTALAVGWLANRGAFSAAIRWLVRGGGVISAGFVLIMAVEQHLCWYCMTAHAGNFAFWVLVERLPIRAIPLARVTAPAALSFAVVTIVLAAVRWQRLDAITAKAQRDLAQTTEQIIEAARVPTDESAESLWPNGFTGRYRLGPEAAPIRIVIFSDYQCVDCQRIEGELRDILARHDDVSLSMKHFPFCPDCNRNNPPNLHPNACWAARAAEAAGILRGNDGFWQMHYWLFDRRGSFVDAELHQALRDLGYDQQQRQQFLGLMQSPQTLELVAGDADEGVMLGLHYTPMILINGVELRGWKLTNAVTGAVEDVAATNPPPATAARDNPPLAAEKYVADWREQPAKRIPADSRAWTIGPQDAKVDVVVWGDYQEPFTAEADGILRRIAGSRPDTRYTFRHYPINKDCNPVARTNKHPLACRAAQAAEAAGTLGGTDAYWAMHEWLMSNQRQFSDATLRQAAVAMRLDAKALFEEMPSADIAAAITEDAQAGRSLNLRSIPMIFINNKFVPRWRFGEHRTLQRMIEEASQ